jgi:hypothetical protein
LSLDLTMIVTVKKSYSIFRQLRHITQRSSETFTLGKTSHGHNHNSIKIETGSHK